jgi:hypothetical protein
MRRIALCVLILCSLSCTSENPLSSSSSATDEDSFFSLVDGGKWVYTHQSSAFVMNSYTEIMRGVHTWLVLSKDAGTGVTTYSLQSGEIDTVHYGQYLPSLWRNALVRFPKPQAGCSSHPEGTCRVSRTPSADNNMRRCVCVDPFFLGVVGTSMRGMPIPLLDAERRSAHGVNANTMLYSLLTFTENWKFTKFQL